MKKVNCNCRISSDRTILGLPSNLHPALFSKLTKTEQSVVLSAASHRRFLESSVIVQEGDPAERLFLLTSGRGRQFVLTRDGRKIPLNSLVAGQIFGGNAVLSSPAKYLASTEVLSKSCALMWDRKTIRRLVAQFPQLLDNAYSIAINNYVVPLLRAKISLCSEDAPSRIADILASLATEVGRTGPQGIEIPVSNEDVAAAANVTPFTVSRCISRWQREGILEKRRGRVILRRTFWPLSETS
jgi:CRP/FNR family transcriptional regulator, nitrogen oxide reductase regulator